MHKHICAPLENNNYVLDGPALNFWTMQLLYPNLCDLKCLIKNAIQYMV